MQNIDPIDYYAQPGRLTDPGPFRDLLTALPGDLADMIKALHGLVALDFWLGAGVLEAGSERRNDLNLRGVQAKLSRILEMDSSPLSKARPFDQRLLGNSRDLSLLLCAALRCHRTPARVRSGFATFFDPIRRFDHWLVEIWKPEESRWQKVDSWMSQIEHEQSRLDVPLREGLASLGMDPLDVHERFFVPGGWAWEHCRSGEGDPENFGTYGNLQGLWFIRDNMLRDLLCLNKVELLPWDSFGFIAGREHKPIPVELKLLDRVADLTQAGEEAFPLLRALDQQTKSLGMPQDFLE